MEGIKRTSIYCNEKLMEIYTESLVGNTKRDPLGEDIFLDLNIDLKTLGEAVGKALAKSRDLSMSEETRKQFAKICDTDGVLDARKWLYQKFPEWKLFDLENDIWTEKRKFYWESVERIYKSKSHTAISRKINKNMQNISIELENANLSFFPSDHDRNEGWSGITKENPALKLTIPSTSSLEVIGAAVKYAIGNCRGKGSDLIRSLLFPDGQPETFEKYIQELGIE